MAGAEPDLDALRATREMAGDGVPVLVNTGAKAASVAAYLEIADGVIVGSDLKQDGYTWNPVDPGRVQRFLKAAGR
jgi:predicted TIM-barrel enzyme